MSKSQVEVCLLGADDGAMLRRVAEEVFDEPLDESLTEEFLRDRRHHLAVAVLDGQVVGFASAVHYVHPDKPTELWVNEVGVAPAVQRCGVGRALLERMRRLASALGAVSVWVLADADNTAARRFYQALGGQPSAAVMYSFQVEADEGENGTTPPPSPG